MAKVERKSHNSKITAHLDLKGDPFDSDIQTGHSVLDSHLRKLARRIGFSLSLKQDSEEPDIQGVGQAFGTAFGEIINNIHGDNAFVRGKSIYSEGLCSVLFTMHTHTATPLSAMDVRMMGGKKYSMDEKLEKFLMGFCDGAKFHVNIVLEKVNDKKHEWESVFESMIGSFEKVLDK